MTINAPQLDPSNRDIAPPGTPGLTVEQLLRMSQQQLDDLFTASPPGEIPDGEAEGVAIVWPGTLRARCIAWFARWFLWQGKVVNRAEGCLVNRISVISLKCIKANVYKAPSWIDEKECIVLDYSKTSFVAKKVRDEIRQVGDRVYLGKVFWGKKRTVDFALDFKKSRAARKLLNWPRLVLILFALLAIYGLWRFNRNAPVTYRDPEEHFKYGSTGGETLRPAVKPSPASHSPSGKPSPPSSPTNSPARTIPRAKNTQPSASSTRTDTTCPSARRGATSRASIACSSTAPSATPAPSAPPRRTPTRFISAWAPTRSTWAHSRNS